MRHNGTYVVWHTAYGFLNGVKSARIALDTATDVADPATHAKRGLVFPELPWGKSVAVLPDAHPGTPQPHLMLWGDSGGGPPGFPANKWGTRAARASSLLGPWSNRNLTERHLGLFLPVRPDHFGSALVESGPPPLRRTVCSSTTARASGLCGSNVRPVRSSTTSGRPYLTEPTPLSS